AWTFVAMEILLIGFTLPLFRALWDLVGVLRAAEPQKKAELYGDLGLTLTYQPNGRRVLVEADLSRVRMVRVGGGI
ncbi:MAG TPA: hypothetical protein VGR13_00845, partial [Actinomycetota bacterium]|nr:hypothetical protein [Actinomycetota bacterium]